MAAELPKVKRVGTVKRKRIESESELDEHGRKYKLVKVRGKRYKLYAVADTLEFVPSERFSRLYEETIEFIKKHEGFAGGKPYYCVAGYLTIGYGHVIAPHEKFGKGITREQAEKLLRKDFNKCVNRALQVTSNLPDNRLLAVAHFIYAKGLQRYLSSTLKIKIDMNQNPNAEFLKWCNYHTPEGELVRSEYSLWIRKWEIRMYNNDEDVVEENPRNREQDSPELEVQVDGTVAVSEI
ncbi:MAG: lysozyme [Bacteroidales bacterium]|nr:lysozyme [Bacteroidales bacterium]